VEFDGVVGELQDIVISEEYEALSKQFFKDNCQVFEDDEENKMEYMLIFKNYEKTIDGYIQGVKPANLTLIIILKCIRYHVIECVIFDRKKELEKRIEGF